MLTNCKRIKTLAGPHQVTKHFEESLCDYTGAKYAVAVNSCTMAILLSCKYLSVKDVEIPSRTYISVPMSIVHSGGTVRFRDEDWIGTYYLKPYPIIDSARRFTSGMYVEGTYMCVSFHASKILGLEQGGAILHDNRFADPILRRMRFDGRGEGISPKDDNFFMLGYHCYMNPSTAAQGILKLHSLGKHNEDLPNDDYPDLSSMEIFKCK